MKTKLKENLTEQKDDNKLILIRKRKRFKRMYRSKKKFKKKISFRKLKINNRKKYFSFNDSFSSEKEKENIEQNNSDHISISYDIINEITLNLSIREKDINNDINFINNIYYSENNFQGVLTEHNKLKELNNENTSLFINDEKFNFKKYNKFDKKGDYTIKLKFHIFLKNGSHMFLGCKNISNIDFSLFKTDKMTHMLGMFNGCEILKTLNLSSFDTKNIINMTGMFYDCYNLINLNLSSFDTKNVIYLGSIFYNCRNLIHLDLSSFDTKNVIDMSYMFYNCYNLINLDLSSFDTKNVSNMSYMFANCNRLKNLNLSSFDIKNVKKKVHMFDDCSNLENIIINNTLYNQMSQELSKFTVTIVYYIEKFIRLAFSFFHFY